MNIRDGFRLTIDGRTLSATAEEIKDGEAGLSVTLPGGRQVFMCYEELPAVASDMGWKLEPLD